MDNPTILITGGHATPAIAVVEELKKTHPSWKVVWVGRKYAMEGSRAQSGEYQLVSRMDIVFVNLTTGRLQRTFTLYTIPSLLKFPIGILESFLILKKYNPMLVVSFGGYIALPVALAAYCLDIPLLTHEQTHKPGLANRIIGAFAKKICVTFPETLSFVPQKKAVVTGLPIRSEILRPCLHPSFPTPKENVPIIYMTGGSTGAQSLNKKLFPIIPTLVRDMIIIHQTGDVSFEKAKKIQHELGVFKSRYIIAPFFQTRDVGWIYHHAAVVVGRSGANTVFEVSALHKRAIFIPLPWAGGDEQTKNAQWLASSGNAIVMQQDTLTIDAFKKALTQLLQQGENISQSVNRDLEKGAVNVVQEIEVCLRFYAKH
ncbi:UDP-N-acetylglucosamine--N-acetylmuramyl-(pentapeptide) pyrophosphoryl-undecaprenol N-acetylglucosamine transferase [Patescibacteria group bacterium]|nr:UDP-N-acetylglucosamine--N-acetylmuramyl-(pentapeptide) pyrophosphoryl-undecaprenol N-acetylglucosamine transferase [Patescibacteria group bacterium]